MLTYLDNAATTYPKPNDVYEAMNAMNRSGAMNAGRGSYAASRAASQLIDETRDRIKKLFNIRGGAECIFAPSATIALNQVIGGMMLEKNATIYVSPYEHNAVARTLNQKSRAIGLRIEELPLEDNLEIDIQKTKYKFTINPPAAVFMSAISNVTGYILPYKNIFDISRQYESINVLDASQAAGLIEIDMENSNVDIAVFAGHKTLYGPFGIAGFVNNGIYLRTYITGGTGSDSLNLNMPELSPGRYEAGSMNVVAISGLHKAMECIDILEHYRMIDNLTAYLIESLQDIASLKVLGNVQKNLGIVSFVVDNYDVSDVGRILDEEFNIAVRTGYHCAPYIHKYLNDIPYGGTVRVGLGIFNTKKDIDYLCEALSSL